MLKISYISYPKELDAIMEKIKSNEEKVLDVSTTGLLITTRDNTIFAYDIDRALFQKHILFFYHLKNKNYEKNIAKNHNPNQLSIDVEQLP